MTSEKDNLQKVLTEKDNSGYFKGLSRRDYIQKAYDLIQKEGIQAVSIRRIAQELGCSSASLYRHFENRDELLYYAELRTLKNYIVRLNQAERTWKNIWDIYVGIWDCYAREAFANPEAYNLLFFTYTNEKLQTSMREYYDMFPEDIRDSNQFFSAMLQTPDFMGRDFEVCKKCVRANVISFENALRMNRMVCMLYKGYLKTILDDGIEEHRMEARVNQFVDDVDRIVMSLAKDMKGYQGYRKRNLKN